VVDLAGVFDTDSRRASTVAATHGTRAFTTLAALLDEVDLVSVCTPSGTHHGIVRAALASGRHVICEKPLAMRASEADELARLANEQGLDLHCCMTVRYRADVRTMVREIRKGLIGTPLLVDTSWLRANGIPGRAGPLAQGVLWDLGSHLVDLAFWATGWDDLEVVSAYGTRLSAGRADAFADWYRAESSTLAPVDHDTVVATFRGPGDVTCRTHVSWAAARLPADRCEVAVVGDEGELRLHTVFGWSPHRQTVRGSALRVRLGTTEWQVVHGDQEREHREYREQFDHMLGRAVDGEEDITGLEPTLKSIALLERAHAWLDVRSEP
jgi:predicted dehydrogenase